MTGSAAVMDVRTITSGRSGPHVLVSAGVHGDEYEPMLAAMELNVRLQGRLLCGRVTVVPVVNASAFAAGTRCGADGLDLARTCPGNPEGSVTEVAAAHISALIREADYYIDLHTGGRLLSIYPLAGYMLHSSADVLAAQRRMAEAFSLPVVWGTEAAPEGRTLSVARDAGVPAIYVEYGGGASVNKRIVSAYLSGCMHVLHSLGMVNGGADKTQRPRYTLEDPSPAGGHLQSKMPSPAGGIFTPHVELGRPVRKGERWGSITTLPEGTTHDVVADRDGIVLFLRATALVAAGESLGGILPVTVNPLKP